MRDPSLSRVRVDRKHLMDIVEEQGPPVQLCEQPLFARTAQEVIRSANIQLRAVNVCHWLTASSRAEMDQRRQLILFQPWLPKDVDWLPA